MGIANPCFLIGTESHPDLTSHLEEIILGTRKHEFKKPVKWKYCKSSCYIVCVLIRCKQVCLPSNNSEKHYSPMNCCFRYDTYLSLCVGRKCPPRYLLRRCH